MATSAPTTPAYLYDVKMTCGGCSGAITRALTKNLPAPNEFKVSLDKQLVLVWGPSLPEFDTVTGSIAKTGKEIRSKNVVDKLEDIPAL